MKFSLKTLSGMVTVLGLVAGVHYPTLAQTSQTPGMQPSPTPGVTPPPATNPNPSIFNEAPYNQQPVRPQTTILLPTTSNAMSIEAIVSESPSFEMFNALLRVADIDGAGLVERLSGDEGNYVVYAPTDEAFAALPEGTIKQLVQPENRDLLVQILSYHIVPSENATSDEANQASTTGEAAAAIESGTAPVSELDSPSQLSDATSSLRPQADLERSPMMDTDRATGMMRVNNARVVGSMISANNGSIYAIDQIIVPPSLQSRVGELGFAPEARPANQAF